MGIDRLWLLSTPAWREPAGLVAILALSGALELWRLNQIGYGNTFYAAAVLSMTQSLHAFLFNSFDPTGFVSIDKPPVGFWVQVLSAKMLGFSGFVILLPEALATVGSVALLWRRLVELARLKPLASSTSWRRIDGPPGDTRTSPGHPSRRYHGNLAARLVGLAEGA